MVLPATHLAPPQLRVPSAARRSPSPPPAPPPDRTTKRKRSKQRHPQRTEPAALDLHQIVVGNAEKYRRQQAATAAQHATYRHRVWDADKIEKELLTAVHDQRLPAAYLRTWYALADRTDEQRRFAQYTVAYLRGGVWIDAEATALQPLVPEFRSPLTVARAGTALHPSWMVVGQIGHPRLRAALDRYVPFEGKTATPLVRLVEQEVLQEDPSVRIVDDWHDFVQAPALPWYARWRNPALPADDADSKTGGLFGSLGRSVAAQAENGRLWNVVATVSLMALAILVGLYVAFRRFRPDKIVRSAMHNGQSKLGTWFQQVRRKLLPPTKIGGHVVPSVDVRPPSPSVVEAAAPADPSGTASA